MRIQILSLSLLLFLISCTGSESSSHSRGKLSEAVDAASDENTGDRKVSAEFLPPAEATDNSSTQNIPPNNIDRIPAVTSDTGSSHQYHYQPLMESKDRYLDSIVSMDESKNRQSDPETDQPYTFGVNGAASFLSSNDFAGMSTLGLSVSTPLEKDLIAEFGAEMTFAPLHSSGKLSHSIDDNVLLFGLNFQIVFPTTADHTLIGQYFLLGAGTNVMIWNYRNPIFAPVYTSGGMLSGQERITSDRLNGVDIFTGIGFDLSQTFPVHLIVEMRPGVIIWTGSTAEGFENDIFANAGYLQFRFKVSFSGIE